MTVQYDLDHWMIAWNYDNGGNDVKVGPWPAQRSGWTDPFDATMGCCHVAYWPKLSREQKLQEIVNGYFYLVQIGLDPKAVHAELRKIEGYDGLELSFFGSGKYIMFQKGRCDPYNP